MQMNGHLSEYDEKAITDVFLHEKNAGILGGYCEDGFPLYYANDKMAKMLGYPDTASLAEGIGGMVANTIHPDDMPQVQKDLTDSYYEGQTYETTYRMLRKDGSWFWTVDKGKVIRTDDGRLAIVSICNDMTDFVRRQKELEQQNFLSESMFKNRGDITAACVKRASRSFTSVTVSLIFSAGLRRISEHGLTTNT